MRRQQNKSDSNMFASTRIAVALCAAIAMVLGAMSVGANRRDSAMFAADSAPATAAGQELANRTSAGGASGPGKSSASNELPVGEPFTPKHSLAVKPPTQQPILLIDPTRPQGNISLSPIKTLITEEKIHIDLEVPVPALEALAPPIPVEAPPVSASISTEPSAEETKDIAETTQSPVLQSNAETTETLSPLSAITKNQEQLLP